MIRMFLAALLFILLPTVALAQYEATSSYCKMVARNHETLATESSLYIGGALAMSQDGKHCGGCYQNKAGRIANNPACQQAQDNGAPSVSEAAVAVCEDRATRYNDPDPKCKAVQLSGDTASKDAATEAEAQKADASQQAKTLNDVDLRGLRLGATFDSAKAVVEGQWKDAVVKTLNERVFLGGRFEYGSFINAYKADKNIQERLNAQFIPPESIVDGAGASEVGSITYSLKRLDRRGVKLSDLTAKLTAKYGPPTNGFVTGRYGSHWIYTQDGQLLTKRRIEDIQASMLAKCEAIDRAKAASEFATCRNEADKQKRCLSMANEYCPYTLSAKWRPMGGADQSLMRGYELNFADVTANTRKNNRIKALKAELEAGQQVDAAPSADIKF